MRMSSPGRFHVNLYVGEELHSTSTGFVDVELCPEQVVVADANVISDSDSSVGPESVLATLPRAFFSVEGVLAMPGDRWLKVGTKMMYGRVRMIRRAVWYNVMLCNAAIREEAGTDSPQILQGQR